MSIFGRLLWELTCSDFIPISLKRDFKIAIPLNYYEQSFRIFSESGVDFVRYLFFWESYERDPFSFMSELQTVAQEQTNGASRSCMQMISIIHPPGLNQNQPPDLRYHLLKTTQIILTVLEERQDQKM
jgi:hypothetical protein